MLRYAPIDLNSLVILVVLGRWATCTCRAGGATLADGRLVSVRLEAWGWHHSGRYTVSLSDDYLPDLVRSRRPAQRFALPASVDERKPFCRNRFQATQTA